jgi:hypothetical protein
LEALPTRKVRAPLFTEKINRSPKGLKGKTELFEKKEVPGGLIFH